MNFSSVFWPIHTIHRKYIFVQRVSIQNILKAVFFTYFDFWSCSQSQNQPWRPFIFNYSFVSIGHVTIDQNKSELVICARHNWETNHFNRSDSFNGLGWIDMMKKIFLKSFQIWFMNMEKGGMLTTTPFIWKGCKNMKPDEFKSIKVRICEKCSLFFYSQNTWLQRQTCNVRENY